MTNRLPSDRPPVRAEPKGTEHIVQLLRADAVSACKPTAAFLGMLAAIQIELSAEEEARLGLFLAGLLRVNEVVNLTAIRDESVAWIKHIFDALTLLPVLATVLDEAGADNSEANTSDATTSDATTSEPTTIIDIGSGCGVPGIPLAICQPNCHVTLLESTGRKCAFLSAIVDMLSLTNVTVIQQRAEDVGSQFKRQLGTSKAAKENEHAMRAEFDVAVCRAVGRIAVATELAVPLVKVGGHVLLVKGQAAGEELAEARHALNLLNATHLGTVETETSKVVALEKRGKTPKIYPRRAGEPARNPLVRPSKDPKPSAPTRTQQDDAE